MSWARQQGFAIPFVLLILMVLAILTTAATYRYMHTTRFLTLSQDNVKARALADSGLEMALVLMRDEDIEWYETGFGPSVTSEELGFAPGELGGEFEVFFEQYDTVYPSAGTFRTLRCVGKSGQARATSLATVKLTSPLTNYLFISNGNMDVAGWGSPTINGPIFVNANGDNGDFRVWHDYRNTRKLDNLTTHSGHTVTFNAQISAAGDIYIKNLDGIDPLTAPPKMFNGKIAPGTIVHNDLGGGATAKGKVVLASELTADPGVELNLDLPTSPDVVGAIGGHPITQALDISSESDGVLVEFIDKKMVVSRVEKRSLGFLYDKDLYQEYKTELVDLVMKNTGNFDSALADKKLQHQVAWDDPGIANAAYPPDLQGDLNGDGQPDMGDRIEIKKIVRGTQLASYDLSDTNMTSLQLKTSNTSYDYGFGRKAPPVFVRGNVDGKAMLSYNVTDDSLDPGLDRLDMMVLNEHEMPNDSSNKLTGGPGVPGGIRYQNPSYRVGPKDSDAGGSDDELIMVSRGTISGSGMNYDYKKKVRDASGTPFDLAQQLRDVEQSYMDYYASGPWPAQAYNVVGSHAVSTTPVQAVLVANQVTFFDHQLSTEGVIVPPRDTTDYPTHFDTYGWAEEFGSLSWPDLAAADEVNAIALRMRNSKKPSHSFDYLRGIYASLGNNAKTVGGDRYYNYEWRRLDAAELGSIGLPLSVVLCSWQRL